jgi:hypothetical protein
MGSRAQRPVLRVNESKNTGAHSAWRGQNPLLVLQYIRVQMKFSRAKYVLYVIRQDVKKICSLFHLFIESTAEQNTVIHS